MWLLYTRVYGGYYLGWGFYSNKQKYFYCIYTIRFKFGACEDRQIKAAEFLSIQYM